MSERFYEKSGEDRYGAGALAGDLAESKVAAACEARNRPLAPFGPRRVSTERAQQMTWPEEVRHAPDFLEFGRFMEVQGCGRSGEVIFKKQKLEALVFWAALMPVWFGIYNSDRDEVMFADLATVLWAVMHPVSEHFVLDEDTRYPKEAVKVPYDLLKERRVKDAFAAQKKFGGVS
jgi:hypothetical protein